MEIKLATESDIATIQQIAHITWPKAYGEILSAAQLEYMLGLMYSHEVLAKQINEQGHYFFIAKTEEGPIGFAGISPTENMECWKLQKLYILPTTQQKGSGKTLLAHVEEFAKEKTAIEMCLQVNRANNAKSFYEKMGYSIESISDLDIGNGYFMNDYIMVKKFKT